MAIAALVHLALQCVNQAVAPFLNLIFHIKDFLPLLALLALQLLALLLSLLLLFDGDCQPGLFLGVFQFRAGVIQLRFSTADLILRPGIQLLSLPVKVLVVLVQGLAKAGIQLPFGGGFQVRDGITLLLCVLQR